MKFNKTFALILTIVISGTIALLLIITILINFKTNRRNENLCENIKKCYNTKTNWIKQWVWTKFIQVFIKKIISYGYSFYLITWI
jgi:hypothetical protein